MLLEPKPQNQFTERERERDDEQRQDPLLQRFSIFMAFLFQKFQEGVRTLAKSPTFARDPRQLQFEADINRLFLYTSYNRLGRNADEKDAEEIIDMAGKASLADQQKQVQDNIHSQIKTFSTWLDEILLPDSKSINESAESNSQKNTQTRSGLSLAVGRTSPSDNSPAQLYLIQNL